jgi:hypothetical protein
MLLTLQVISVFLVGVAMSLALAHALKYPGKMRLDQRTYMAVQAIYYPGFTIAGAAEPLAIIATVILALAVRNEGGAFWWTLASLIAVAAMHIVFWTITQPTNRYWLKDQQISKGGARFFAVDRSNPEDRTRTNLDWTALRDRWEYSHIVRAALSAVALIALVVAIAH